jgi:hypothetical protein
MIHFFLVLLFGVGRGSCEPGVPPRVLAKPASPASSLTVASCSLTGNGKSQHCTVTATGGFAITQIKVGDTILNLTAGVDYEIREGLNGTSEAKFSFRTPPTRGAAVTITITGKHSSPDPFATWD